MPLWCCNVRKAAELLNRAAVSGTRVCFAKALFSAHVGGESSRGSRLQGFYFFVRLVSNSSL